MTRLTFTIGLVLLTAGCAWAWPPLGLIVPGAVICGLMVWSQTRAGREEPDQEPGEAPPDV